MLNRNFPNFIATLILTLLLACGGGGTGIPVTSGGGGTGGGGTPNPVDGPGSYGFEVYVSPSGSDADAGTAEKPFLSFEQARTAVRAQIAKGLPTKGIAVWLRGGTYARTATLELNSQDSGTESIPVVWRGYPGETVRVVGGKKLDPAWFTPVTSSSAVWSRLDASARGTVLQVDLSARGITDYGALLRRGFGNDNKAALELSINGKVQSLARWPDADQNTPPADVNGASVQVYGSLTPDVTGTFNKVGTNDGVSAFERVGLVGGKQYRLYRRSGTSNGSAYTAWYLTTSTLGSYPSNTDPWWSFYQPVFGTMNPTNGAVGNPKFADPATSFNHGFTTVVGTGTETSFTMASDRLGRWSAAPDPWVYGCFAKDWADDHLAITAMDSGKRQITLAAKPYLSDQGAIQDGQPWYAENLLEEITQPGEWYLDRAKGLLYLWPTAGFSSAEVVVSVLDGALFNLNGATGVQLRELSLESTRTNLVAISNGSGNTLQQLWLRNAGTNAVKISGGIRHRVTRCHVVDPGEGGVMVSGGDRKALTRGDHVVEDSEFEGFGRFARMYHQAISLDGVGLMARHNLIHDGPHEAIQFTGNDNLVELNEIRNVCQTTSDAGVIYTGRDWGARGNVVKNNFVHDIRSIFVGYGVHGIYLDDAVSGIEVNGNVVYKVSGHAIQHGGGRDNVMVNNLLVRNGDALSPDTRAQGWWKEGRKGWPQGSLLTALQAFNYQANPWASRYPACAAIPNDWATVTANEGNPWLYPQGCVFSRNLGFANKSWITDTKPLAWYQEQKDNVSDQDPLFVDEANLDLTLKSGSPALAIPGFKPIPFKSIGLRSEALPPR